MRVVRSAFCTGHTERLRPFAERYRQRRDELWLDFVFTPFVEPELRDMTRRPNKSAALERRESVSIPIEDRGRGVGEPSRSAIKFDCPEF